MKLTKSYTVKIGGNKSKIGYLKTTLKEVEEMSNFVFDLGKEKWYRWNELYKSCRIKFPNLNSKVVQNFLRLNYFNCKGKKLPKKSVKASILIDFQSFDVQKTDTKLTNYWLKFHLKRFPLFGKRNLEKILNFENVKLIQIYIRDEQLYCKLSVADEIQEPVGSSNPDEIVGLDINSSQIVLSNNQFYHYKQLKHRKIERYKNNQKQRNLNNFTKNEVHNLTSKIVKDLQNEKLKVLVLEDLKHLRKSCTEKQKHKGTSKKNYVINSLPFGMFRSFLEYKCAQVGIRVVTTNPAYTSQTCSECRILGSRNGFDFVCSNCDFKLDSDLNGSRNIKNFYMNSLCATSQFGASSDF